MTNAYHFGFSSDDPLRDENIEEPSLGHKDRPKKFPVNGWKHKPGNMGKDLCAGTERQGIGPHHPCAVNQEFSFLDGRDTKRQKQGHRASDGEADEIEIKPVVFDPWIKLRHPQSGESHGETKGDQNFPRDPVIGQMPFSKAGRELEGPEQRVEGHTEDVKGNRHRSREEPRVLLGDHSAMKLQQAVGAREEWNNAQENQDRGYEPFFFCWNTNSVPRVQKVPVLEYQNKRNSIQKNDNG